MKSAQSLFRTPFLRNLTLGISLSALASLSFASQTIQLENDQQQLLGITSAPAVPVATYPSPAYSGQVVVALDQAYLITAPLSGLVTQLHHFHGAAQKGDVIAHIQSPALLTAQKDFLNTLSDFKNAQHNLERAEKLMKTGVVSTKSYQTAKADYSKALQIKRQQQQDLALLGMAPKAIQTLIETQQLQPALLQITAPAEGELFDLQIKLGQRLEANQAIVSLGSTHPIVIEVPVPVEKASQLLAGQSVQISTRTTSDLKGEIELVPNRVDPLTQAVMVHIEVNNTDRQLIPGQQVQVQFLIAPQTPTQTFFQAPRNAIAQLDRTSVIFVKNASDIQAVPIEVLNFINDTLYFTPLTTITPNSQLVISSTSAVKALFEAGAEGGE